MQLYQGHTHSVITGRGKEMLFTTTHIAQLKVLPHQEVEGGGSLGARDADGRAAVTQQT